jgi:hypothetical protein
VTGPQNELAGSIHPDERITHGGTCGRRWVLADADAAAVRAYALDTFGAAEGR